jgi:vacuolar-type H+-ATPase subunit E/Vma4
MSEGSIELEAKLIERIVERRNEIVSRADERAEAILKAAEKDCERIRTESEKQVLNIVGSELRAVRDRIVGRSELEGRKLLMEARDEVSSSVFEEVEKRLRQMAEGRDKSINFGEVLIKLIIEAASAVDGDEFIVEANGRDLKYLGENLRQIKSRMKKALGGGSIRLDSKPIPTMGGVLVRNSDGTKIYYNTLEGRLKSVRSRIEAAVAKTLGVI